MANTDYKLTRDNNIYVIAGLPAEAQVKYKYYADIKTAVDDAPPGSSIVVEAGLYTINNTANLITITKNINIHFNAGAVIDTNIQNTITITSGDVNITGYLQAIVRNTSDSISGVLLYTTGTTGNTVNAEIAKITSMSASVCVDLRASGVFNIKIGEISSTLTNASIVIQRMNVASVLEISKINSPINLTPATADDTISGTIKNTFVKGSSTGGMIYIADAAVMDITIQNSKIYNTSNTAGGAGIEHVSGFVGLTVKLIGTVIQTTHASSASISTDDAMTLMALNSWANKATSGTVNETVTGGFTVEADVKV